MANILSSPYEEICSVPHEDIDSDQFKSYLNDDSDADGRSHPVMSDIVADNESIK